MMSDRVLPLNLVQAKHVARLERDERVDTSTWTAPQLRSFMRTRTSLIRWGLVKDHQITPKGKAALDAYRKQNPEHNV